MHIAFDGGCFQQTILGGIYQVACGFLNAAKTAHSDLRITLVCDSRQGLVRDEALEGLSFRPEVIYAPVAVSYDPPEPWPSFRDPQVRFYVDGQIMPAAFADDGVVRYVGPAPTSAFAIISRAAKAAGSDAGKRGIRVQKIAIAGERKSNQINGSDRRLVAGFLDNNEGGARWTDGAGFVPLSFFADTGNAVTVEVWYVAQDEYCMSPGGGADLVRQACREAATAERSRRIESLAADLRERGCGAYFVNHFTPVHLPGMINVAWAYDLIPILFPQYFHADARLNFNENLRVFAAADRIYAISDCTRDDIVAHTEVSAEQVVTAGVANSEDFSPRPTASVRRTLGQLGLRERGYILAVATIEPRKNHLRMLIAYIDLRNRLPNCPDLVLVGKMGWDFEAVLALRAEHNLECCVLVLSDVPVHDLACLYSGAMFSAYLSVYEGFGLPILESMASGCPVLTSDRSSMAEVAGGAALLANPYNIDDIGSAMERMVGDSRLRADLARRGHERAKVYDWAISSEIIMRDLVVLTGRS